MVNGKTLPVGNVRRTMAAAVSCAFIAVVMFVVASTQTAHGRARALIPSVREAAARQDYAAGERLIADYRRARGVTPEMLEALSWLGRAALGAERWEQADGYARQTYDLALAALRTRPMDAEPRLPIALGAAIEVRAHVMAQSGARSEAVAFLHRQFATYGSTSIGMRIQKNVNLLSLEGQPAPSLDLSEALASRPIALSALKGKVVLLFFWAHWCSDCKAQAPALAALAKQYGAEGLAILGPTQRYGYVAGGREAPPDEELEYMRRVRQTYYGFLDERAVPISTANHLRYGVSTTPTLVLLDRDGLVRLYHPGTMPAADLDRGVRQLLSGSQK